MKDNKVKITLFAIFTIVFFMMISIDISAIAIEKGSNVISIIVDKNGNGDYITIQEAIDNALENSIIYVKNGEYSEVLDIDIFIELIGENKDKTIINPISEENKYAIKIGAPNIKIEQFTIQNGAPGLYTTGIKISAKNTLVESCNIINTAVGIAVWTSENQIKNCDFRYCKDEGIALLGSKKNQCNNNIISNCIFYDNCDGIELQYSKQNKIINCKFFDNTHTGIDAIAKQNNDNIISNCEIKDNAVHGIYFSASSNNQIINCIIENNKDGNIESNKYSKNNQIISFSQNQKNTNYNKIKQIISTLLEKIISYQHIKLSKSRSFKF